MVKQYLDHSKAILSSKYSDIKSGSKGSDIISLPGYKNEYDLREGFPLLTTKRMAKKAMFHELIWFMKGDSNIKYLEDNNCSVWRGNAFEYNLPGMIDEGIFPKGIVKYSLDWDNAMEEYGQRIKENSTFAEKWGDAGPIYGPQWRGWNYFDEDKKEFVKIDQLGGLINKIKKKPTGKKHLVTAWNPGDVPRMSLPPCHVLFQMHGNEQGQLDLELYQRSCDMFLGVPFNIASYATLLKIIAQETGMEARRFIHAFGDSHFYAGLEKRGKWYRENFGELKDMANWAIEKEEKYSSKEGYISILNWINRNAPKDENEEKYDHVTAILEQLSRDPFELPTLEIADKRFDELTINDFKIIGYEHGPAITREMAV